MRAAGMNLPLFETQVERLLHHGQDRASDASHLAAVMFQTDPLSYWPLYTRCLCSLQEHDAAFHAVSRVLSLLDDEESLRAEQASSPAAAALCANTSEMAKERLALHVMRMRCCFAMGDHRGCRSSAEFVLAPNEHNAATVEQQVQALCFVAQCAEAYHDPAQAATCYLRALQSDPWCLSALHTLIDHHLLPPCELLQFIEYDWPLPAGCDVLRGHFLHVVGAASPSSVATSRLAPRNEQPVAHPQSTVAEEPATPPAATLLEAAFARCPPTAYGSAVAHRAAVLHTQNQDVEASRVAAAARHITPFEKHALCTQLAILVNQRATAELFDVAHTLSRGGKRSRGALAVYAVGCYYFALANYEKAGRFFSRATELDTFFAHAWIGFGHCYARLEEGEQALCVYRRARTLFPGLSACAAFMGMQYSRIHTWRLAMLFLEEASSGGGIVGGGAASSPSTTTGPPHNARRHGVGAPHHAAVAVVPCGQDTDPLVWNEIAALHVRSDELVAAQGYLERAVELLVSRHPTASRSRGAARSPSALASLFNEHLDCILFNLATVYRKLRRYQDAVVFYSAYVQCRPRAAHGHAALGFCFHLMGQYLVAVHHYHIACSLKQESFTRDMLDRALESAFGPNAKQRQPSSAAPYWPPMSKQRAVSRFRSRSEDDDGEGGDDDDGDDMWRHRGESADVVLPPAARGSGAMLELYRTSRNLPPPYVAAGDGGDILVGEGQVSDDDVGFTMTAQRMQTQEYHGAGRGMWASGGAAAGAPHEDGNQWFEDAGTLADDAGGFLGGVRDVDFQSAGSHPSRDHPVASAQRRAYHEQQPPNTASVSPPNSVVGRSLAF